MRIPRLVPVTLTGVLVLVGLMPTLPALAGNETRAERQVRLMEHAFDQMLLDSRNWLINRDPSHGYYETGRGVVISFKASLVGSNWDDDSGWSWSWSGHSVSRRHQESDLESQGRRYERGKREIVQTLVDFGEALTHLGNDEWLEVRARLRGAELFEEEDLSRLRVRISLGDLRSFYEGRIDEDQLSERFDWDES